MSQAASPEQKALIQALLKYAGPVLEQYGFTLIKRVTEEFSSSLTYRKETHYIELLGNTYPQDYPPYFNIELGEGSSKDWPEWDWNGVALWALARNINPESSLTEFSFPPLDRMDKEVQRAVRTLKKYGENFLKGDLREFYAARAAITARRQPYKIHTPNSDGSYATREDSASAELKRKYSQ